jgi:2-keto-4-pentenoate hydratase/2-oxohepta-3-ene-1,7-dioic acid hydratase in catechol pathway
MRFVSYRVGETPAWGVLVGDKGVVDRRELGSALPNTLREFIALSALQPGLLAAVQARALAATAGRLDAVTLEPCVPDPGKIICLGVNYHDHAKEGGNIIADYPAFFLRCNTSLLAHGGPLQVSPSSDKLDFEAELAVVIGQRTRFVSEADALQAVFGYACFNDGSYRDYQRKASQWTIGKNFDASGGFGPSLVTADELPLGCVGLGIRSILNGKVMQDANTKDMVFGVARTISLLSECLTLEPGDVLVMGTPGGVGYARTPPVWMKAGDTIEIDIEGVGILSNPVTA